MRAAAQLAQDREFVAAQAGHYVGWPHDLLDAARRAHQELVAGAVAHAVVDTLEPVEIQVQDRELMRRIAAMRFDRLRQAFVEAVAIREVRQAVVVGDVLEPALGETTVGDVLHLKDQAGLRLVGIGEDRAVQQDPQLGVFARAAAQFEDQGVELARQHGLQLRVERVGIVRDQELAERRAAQVLARALQQGAQRVIGSQQAAIDRHQSHADGGVREGALKALFAALELVQVMRLLRGFALSRLGALPT